MQFGMLTQVGSGFMYYMGCRRPNGKGSFGVSGRVKIIVKHRICRLGKRVSYVKTSELILTICTSYDVFLYKKLPFARHNDCICVKNF